MSRRTDRFVRIASATATGSLCKQTLGAVVVRGSVILGSATNRFRNLPENVSNGHRSTHAEVAALSLVGDATGTHLYVSRVTRAGNLTMSRPCRACRQAIVNAGVSRVTWTDWDGVVRTERVDLNWMVAGEY